LKNGVQVACNSLKILDSGFRRNDEKWSFSTFYELINIVMYCFHEQVFGKVRQWRRE